jgi:hypothetical protein
LVKSSLKHYIEFGSAGYDKRVSRRYPLSEKLEMSWVVDHPAGSHDAARMEEGMKRTAE